MGRLVRLLTTPSATEGLVIRGRLESEGIPVLVKGEAGGPYPVGPMHLWVEEEHEVQARLILGSILGGEMALEEDEVPETDPEDG